MLYDAKGLSYHKISKVETYKVRTHFPRLVGKNAFRDEHAYGDEVVVKRIFTDQGACGWGLASGLFYHQDLSVDQKILGKSVAEVFDPAVGIASDDLSTFDFALHDLAGQIMNVPCY